MTNNQSFKIMLGNIIQKHKVIKYNMQIKINQNIRHNIQPMAFLKLRYSLRNTKNYLNRI